MKRIIAVLAALLFGVVLAACGKGISPDPAQPAAAGSSFSAPDRPKMLVAYFSATGHTEQAAYSIQESLGTDLYEITPAVPYSAADLDYHDEGCRANAEQRDPSARPAIAGREEKLDEYDVVFLGYPIWWGKAPKVVYTFLESYDFGNAVIVPFCTSGGSGIGNSIGDLRALAPDARWTEGRRFESTPDREEVLRWADSLGIGPGR